MTLRAQTPRWRAQKTVSPAHAAISRFQTEIDPSWVDFHLERGQQGDSWRHNAICCPAAQLPLPELGFCQTLGEGVGGEASGNICSLRLPQPLSGTPVTFIWNPGWHRLTLRSDSVIRAVVSLHFQGGHHAERGKIWGNLIFLQYKKSN